MAHATRRSTDVPARRADIPRWSNRLTRRFRDVPRTRTDTPRNPTDVPRTDSDVPRRSPDGVGILPHVTILPPGRVGGRSGFVLKRSGSGKHQTAPELPSPPLVGYPSRAAKR